MQFPSFSVSHPCWWGIYNRPGDPFPRTSYHMCCGEDGVYTHAARPLFGVDINSYAGISKYTALSPQLLLRVTCWLGIKTHVLHLCDYRRGTVGPGRELGFQYIGCRPSWWQRIPAFNTSIRPERALTRWRSTLTALRRCQMMSTTRFVYILPHTYPATPNYKRSHSSAWKQVQSGGRAILGRRSG
ncbi:hypothetical protein EJ06DRAFT_60164 [Trichodelitschia bisporula]|uniref:Uncharacterized protein n=1 Tax=Trichodelitschia bisporula TaxID=703511 RepID=A0A6G1HUV0_9PEZI|nr:hypothetical protein EJ06DRAFT_60164 [Trichodelitschia bisporula]